MNSAACRPRIVPFVPEHYRRMRLRKDAAADLAGLSPASLVSGWSGGSTVLLGDAPAFLYGALLDEGVGVIWAVTSPLTGRLGLLITRIGLRPIATKITPVPCVG